MPVHNKIMSLRPRVLEGTTQRDLEGSWGFVTESLFSVMTRFVSQHVLEIDGVAYHGDRHLYSSAELVHLRLNWRGHFSCASFGAPEPAERSARPLTR